MKKFYIYQNNQQQGPYSSDDLRNMNIRPDTMVWAEGMGDWMNASRVQELSYIFQAAPPPPPSTPPPPSPGGYANQSAPPRQNAYQAPVKKKSGGKVVGIIVSIIAVIVIAILVMYLIQPGEPEWKNFTSTQGGFSVNMPASVEESSQILPSDVGNMTLYTYLASIRGGSFTVAYVDYPGQIMSQMSQRDIYLEALNGSMTQVGCRVNSEWNVNIDGYTGLRYEASGVYEGDNIESKGIYILRGNRLYMIMILNKELQVSFDMVDNFLGSFTFI